MKHICITLLGLSLGSFAFSQDKEKDKKKDLFTPQPPIAVVAYTGPAKIDYEIHIAPILENKCLSCHAGPVKSGRYDMSTVEAIIQGGKAGKAVVPGKPMESLLIKLAGKTGTPAMPPKDDEPLTPAELAMLKEWVAQGATAGTGTKAVKPSIKLTKLPKTVQPVLSLAISADKKLLAVGRGASITLHETAKGAMVKTLHDANLKDDKGQPLGQSQLDVVHTLAFSPDGKTLVAGGYQEVTFWDVEKGTIQKKITGFLDRVLALDFSSDGKQLAIAGGLPTQDGEVKVLAFPSGELALQLKSPHSDAVFGVRFRSDGKLLATASADKFAKVWTVKPYVRPEQFQKAASLVGSLIAPTNGTWPSRYNPASVQVARETWSSIPAGEMLRTLEGHTNHVTDICWRADGNVLASSGADNVIKVWDLERGEQIRNIGGHTKPIARLSAMSASPFVVSACGDSGLRQWNIDNGGNVRNFNGATEFQHSVVVTADGSLVAAGGEDGVVRVYNGQNTQLMFSLPGVK